MPRLNKSETISISEAELKLARNKLSNGKAAGSDLLPDSFIKNNLIWDAVKEKIRQSFEEWINGAELPDYILDGRIFALSKEDTAFPKYGKVRTIAILSIVRKLYELVLQIKLSEETKRLQFVPTNQLGFSTISMGT